MSRCITVSTLLFFSLWKASTAQAIISEIEFDHSSIERIRGAVVNDSIFLTIEGLRTVNSMKRNFYWIRPDGRIRAIPLALHKDQFIYATGYTQDEEYYYYPEESGKLAFLRAIVFNKKTKEISEGTGKIEIPGTLYGSYVEDGRLYILLAEKKSYKLQLISIKGLEVESRKDFNLTFDLGNYKTEQAKFTIADEAFIPSKGFSPIKITKHSGSIWISVDEPNDLDNSQAQPGMLYKTTVIKLDLANTERSFVKSFFESRPGYFSSRIFDNKLFRTYLDYSLNATTIEVFDLTTAQKIFTRTFTNKSDLPETHYYLRDIDNKIKKQITTKPFFRMGTDIAYVDSVAAGSYVLAIGAEHEYKPTTGLLHGFGIAGLLASVAVQAAVQELSNSDLIHKYIYLKLDLEGNLTTANEVNLPAKDIDDFEIKQFGYNSMMALKGYLATNKSIFAVYLPKKSSTLKIYNFSSK